MDIEHILQLLEARKNPEKNPKVSAFKKIEQRINDAPSNRSSSDSVFGDNKNLFVSFTKIDKLGINPTSDFETPLGIYSYPASYVYNMSRRYSEDLSLLPYAGSNPYVNIFEASGNIIDLNNMTSDDAHKYYEKMSKWALENRNQSNDESEWKRIVDEIEKEIQFAPTNANHPDIIGGKFWYVSMRVAHEFKKKSSKGPVAWNKLFRYMGIDGCIDDGTGIIHSFEPNQAVFFSKSAIKNNERVYNKWSEKSQSMGKRFGSARKKYIEKIKNMDPHALQTEVNLRPSKVLDTLYSVYKKIPEEIQQIVVQKSPEIFLHDLISSYNVIPSENVLMAALNVDADDTLNVLFDEQIDVPEKVQLAAIEKNPRLIDSIDNPTETALKKARDKGVAA